MFASDAHLESVCILLVVACHLNVRLYQMGIKSAFLNGILQEKVYVEQPKELINYLYLDHVYRLKKALYGLK